MVLIIGTIESQRAFGQCYIFHERAKVNASLTNCIIRLEEVAIEELKVESVPGLVLDGVLEVEQETIIE